MTDTGKNNSKITDKERISDRQTDRQKGKKEKKFENYKI